MPATDIVVPVHNSLYHARPCVESVLHNTKQPFHLYVVDDGSDAHVHAEMASILAPHGDRASLCRNPTAIGYLSSVNLGIRAGQNPTVVLLNSDVVVSPGWLSHLLFPFDDDPAVGIINPVSNWANWTRIPFAPGFTIHDYAEFVAEIGDNAYADIYNASGFCFAARRTLLEELGLFDEAYAPGYWEETDLCLKALEHGHRVVVNLGSFVYHFGWGSFRPTGRNEWLERNREIFTARWGKQFEELKRRWQQERVLAELEEAVHARQREVEQADTRWQGWLKQARRFGLRHTASAMAATLSNALLRSDRDEDVGERFAKAVEKTMSMTESDRPAENHRRLQKIRRRFAGRVRQTSRPATAPSGPGRLRVVYLLPALKLYGGILSVLQIVNHLALAGEQANVATYGECDPDLLRGLPLYASPYCFPSRSVMLENFPECDVVVATRWDTAYDAIMLQEAYPRVRLAYFVQDYEPDFYPIGSQLSHRAELTYHLIGKQIVKTQWLARKLRRFDSDVVQIPLGLNLDIYYDSGNPARQECTRVLAMARPTSKYRNYEGLLRIFTTLHEERPDIELCLYGTDLDPESLPFPCDSQGRLYRMADVAALLNRCTILLDCSTFQGFGRPGLEAMATRTAAVLTRNGGITEYAKHLHNCLLADPLDVDENVAKIIQLADEVDLRRRLIDRGVETARQYDARLEGARTRSFLRSLVGLE